MRQTPTTGVGVCYIDDCASVDSHLTTSLNALRVLQALSPPLKDRTEERRKPPSGIQAHPHKREQGARPRKGELRPTVPTHQSGARASQPLDSRGSAYGGDSK